MTQSPSEEGLTAFSPACPAPEDVTAVLAQSGFQLTFQMQAMIYPTYSTTASLPAQFHYRDAVIMYHQKSTPLTPLERLPPVRGPQCSTEVKAKRARPCHSPPFLRGLDSLCSVKH